ncbi:phosphonate ABC transporter, permease protein PhnE [Corynebacterium sputi]|uniref:phosphonate ABC transporter, permease protein PhnE n=1 Tax=Corynebacterium sputi TaxID=489915 RepID=UPI0004016B3B|nr:phosphonate ABC transporter, permease protein PhnE [Corynebacterium sputi]
MSSRTLERPARRATFSGVAVPLVLVAMVVVGAWSVYDLGINPASIINSMENAVAFTGRMFPLDFPPIGELLSLIAETFAIVFLATVLSVLFSVPIAVAAASSTARNKLGRGTARTVIVIARAIPDLVLAILFVRVFGLGATAGILAMGIHSVGMVGKLYADAIEELDDGPRTAIESAGTRRSQQLWAAIPQKLMPQLIATALHRFDINLRTSVLLGYVGVGGLGLAIADALRVLDYQRGMALALVVLAICIITELISGTIRAALLGGSHAAKGTWVDRMWGGRREATGTLPPWSVDRVRRVLTFVAVIGLVLWSWSVANISVANLATGVMNLPEVLALFFPPSAGGIGTVIWQQMLVTVQIAFAATFLGAILALPIGIFAARNIVRNRYVHGFFRMIIVVIRGIPELILAIIFVVISGLGAVAGTLALAVGAVGLLSKLSADSLEETDVRVQEAIRTGGASEPQVFFSATVRQSAPAFVAHMIYLLDTNIRSATLLGVVGAGGIGFQLLNATRVNQFEVVTYILLMLIAVVLIIELLAMWIRKSVR